MTWDIPATANCPACGGVCGVFITDQGSFPACVPLNERGTWERNESANQLESNMDSVANLNTVEFSTGAVRSADRVGERYDLISPIGLRRLAMTCHEGAVKYSDYNWERGMPISEMLNHGIAHLYAYLSGDRSEDHLAHAAWNCFGAMHSEELWPELNQSLRTDGCKPPKIDD